MRKKYFLFLIFLIYPFLLDVMATEIIVGFSPEGSAQQVILSAINDAKKSIDLAAYTFTSKTISLALIKAYKNGVKIRILADKKVNLGKYTAVTFLANYGISVRLNGQYAIQHNKFMIIDGISVQTGSFNYSKNANTKNAENVIYIHDVPIIAKIYTINFNKLWDHGLTLKNQY